MSAVEARRGCGFRKIGGTYLETEVGAAFACGRMPLPLKPCPVCTHEPPFTRGLAQVTAAEILHSATPCRRVTVDGGVYSKTACAWCPLASLTGQETAGLMWVGEGHYTPEEFIEEAQALGVSKRIGIVPRWLKLGETWIFLVHARAVRVPCRECGGDPTILDDRCPACDGHGHVDGAGVFFAFRPQRLVRIVGDDMPEADRRALEKRGFTVKVVPHDDPDH